MNNRISEPELILPALEALEKHSNTGLSTSELIPILREVLKPSGDDLKILLHRNDDYFSGKVRNLRSHRTLNNKGLASFDGDKHHITLEGKKFVAAVSGGQQSFAAQGFKRILITLEKQFLFIEEGHTQNVNKNVRARSTKLRDLAREHYAEADGTIVCKACGFEGTGQYGEKAKGLIEIHHTKPIATAGESSKEIKAALKDVVPLCPNCHRMVHRNPKEVMDVKELCKILKVNN